MNQNIFDVVDKLGKYYNKKLSQDQINFFLEELDGFSDKDLQFAIDLYKKDFNNSRMPLPSQILALLQTSGIKSFKQKELDKYKTECVKQWEENHAPLCRLCTDLGTVSAIKNSDKIKYQYTFRCNCKASQNFSELIPQWHSSRSPEYTKI